MTFLVAGAFFGGPAEGGEATVVAWNDLGMHCIDPDFSLFSILPPFNNINGHVIVNGQIVDAASGYTLTYEGVQDASGSINTTSIGKTNFWDHVQALFGVALPPDMGLAGNAMPGPGNVPQPMHFNPSWNWFAGEGIPITFTDDALQKNPYPLLRLVARDPLGNPVGSTVTVAPVSGEVVCSRCHASGASPFARPEAGWAFDPDPLRDDRLNILQLHDERHDGDPLYDSTLAQAGYDANGLLATALGGTSVLCARCHGSNALPGSGLPGVSASTAAVHSVHANVVDETNVLLGDMTDRASCYACHPGKETKCLRGAMGKAIDTSGELMMQCQDCHGSLAEVGDPARVGWLEEPTCQNCHTGSATQNSGQIRYESAYDEVTGDLRVAASNLFATTPDTPAPGFSLYRFSEGHGGLQCAACHGPPHAIYPTNFVNDNEQSIAVQGHVGTITDCTTCHANLEDNQVQGPHGMHPVSQKWVQDVHKDRAEQQGLASCRACHGTDLRGTVLSRAQGDRTFSTEFGTKTFWRGSEIGCYACHDGPDEDHPNPNRAPVAADLAFATPVDVPIDTPLSASDQDGDALAYRIVSQPRHGTVAIAGGTATYLPAAGAPVGVVDTFEYAARDGEVDSNLAVVSVSLGTPDCEAAAQPVGFGCPGTGGFVPTLSLEGCPEVGEPLTMSIAGGLGGAKAVLLLGTGGLVEPWDGCVLRVGTILRSSVVHLSAGGAGEGTAVLPFALPAQFAGQDLTLQVFIRDNGLGQRGTLTNAIELTVP